MEPTYRIAQRLLASRAAVGVKQYGDDLTANSPGCMIKHALEEAADQVNYLLAEIQRRADAIRKLIAMVDDMEAQGYWPMMHRANAVIDLLGGRAALAQYDEILGTVANSATVAIDPRDEALRVANEKPANSNCHQCEQVQQSLRKTHAEFDAKMRDTVKLAHELGWNGVDNSKFMSVFLRDYFEQLSADNSRLREALRVAADALEYCRKEFWGMSMREATDSWLGHVANQAEDKTKQALAAIRAAEGGR